MHTQSYNTKRRKMVDIEPVLENLLDQGLTGISQSRSIYHQKQTQQLINEQAHGKNRNKKRIAQKTNFLY